MAAPDQKLLVVPPGRGESDSVTFAHSSYLAPPAAPVTAADAGSAILAVQNLCVHLGGRLVLDSVSLSVRPGDFIALIGPNGGGKTTFLRAALGLIPLTSGTVSLFGGAPQATRARVGYLPQRTDFDATFPITGREVVASGQLVGLTGRDRGTISINQALEEVGMQAVADRAIGHYSGGQLQRLMLARALVGNPELLLLDEPTAHLDAQFNGSFYDLLARIQERMPIVMTTHDIGAVSTYVKSVGCLSRKLYYHGTRELTHEMLEQAYGCPMEVVGHAVPHRLFSVHGQRRVDAGQKGQVPGDA